MITRANNLHKCLHKVLSIYFAGAATADWLFGHAGSISEVLTFGCLLYFFSLGAWGCVYAYTPEVYPTVVRASGSGWAAAFGRLGAFTAPFIVTGYLQVIWNRDGLYLRIYHADGSICNRVSGCS